MGYASEPETPLPEYVLPKAGVLSYLPHSWIPYAELIRLDKPTGFLYLYFPCVFGTFLAALLAKPITPPFQLAATNGLFLIGSVLVRGVGCTWNDILDREVDRKVSRTGLRPMARGAISVQDAVCYTFIQLVIILGLLMKWSMTCFFYSIPLFILTGLYPLAKRVTNYPQIVLGYAFSWGIIMAFPALHLDIMASPSRLASAGCLYASGVSWTILYDTIYAIQDVKDDTKAGIKSIAVRHKSHTKVVLAAVALVQVLLLAITGLVPALGYVYFAGTCGGTIITLGVMLRNLDAESPANCLWWFKYGCWMTGGAIASGLIGEYITRLVLV